MIHDVNFWEIQFKFNKLTILLGWIYMVYLVCKENAVTFVFFGIVNPWVAKEVDGSMVRNVFKSQTHKEKLSLHKILDIKCSRNSTPIIPFKINFECRLACSQSWQWSNDTFQKGSLSKFPFSVGYPKKRKSENKSKNQYEAVLPWLSFTFHINKKLNIYRRACKRS